VSAVPARFTFDLDLGNRSGQAAAPSEAAIAKRIEAARKEGYDQGLAEGERNAASRATRQLAAAIDALATRTAQLAAAEAAERTARTADAIALALAAARKLAGALIERHPQAQLEALFAEALSSLDQAPHIVIRCHPDLVDSVEPAARAKLAERGLATRLVVVGDGDIKPGDGRIEWADGGLVRDSDRIAAGIDTAIATFLATGRPEESRQ
jgi:flagellar assembly protein FliH